MKLIKKILNRSQSLIYAGAMERTRFALVVLTGAFVLFTALGINDTIQANKVILGNSVLYTRSTEFSRSGTELNVVNIYTNPTETRAVILLHTEDTSYLTINPDEYSLFLTQSLNGVKAERPSGSIRSELAIYGSTGYMAIMLENNQPFDSDVLRLVIRNNKILNTFKEGTPVAGDKSFVTYDQALLYFNPAGDERVTLDEVTDNGFGVIDYEKLYAEAILDTSKKALDREGQQILRTMHGLYLAIPEYVSRLEIAGVKVPDLPESIINDLVEIDDSGNYQLMTDYVLDGALNFNTTDVDVTEGWVRSLRGDMSTSAYISYIDNAYTPKKVSFEGMTWLFTDGASLDSIRVDNPALFTSIMKDKAELEHILTDIYNLKYDYQKEHLLKYLELEQDLEYKSSTINVTRSTDDGLPREVLVVYPNK